MSKATWGNVNVCLASKAVQDKRYDSHSSLEKIDDRFRDGIGHVYQLERR